MRLDILDNGHTLGKKALMAFIRTVSRVPVPDIVKLVLYRPDFLGTPMNVMVHEAMRGPSEWSVAEREMMAAYVSKTNECEFWTNAHAAVAAKAWDNDAKVQAVLADLERAPIDDKLRATLRMLHKLTKEGAVTADDMRALLGAGVTKAQIEDALSVCFAFNIIDRLADTFEFHVGPRAHFDAGARHLLTRGYK